MTKEEFENYLNDIASKLKDESRKTPFAAAKQFEQRVREIAKDTIKIPGINIDFNPHPQAFPDIEIGEFGIEVKFTTNDEWRSVANSVLETNRIESVKHVYIMFGKMGVRRMCDGASMKNVSCMSEPLTFLASRYRLRLPDPYSKSWEFLTMSSGFSKCTRRCVTSGNTREAD